MLEEEEEGKHSRAGRERRESGAGETLKQSFSLSRSWSKKLSEQAWRVGLTLKGGGTHNGAAECETRSWKTKTAPICWPLPPTQPLASLSWGDWRPEFVWRGAEVFLPSACLFVDGVFLFCFVLFVVFSSSFFLSFFFISELAIKSLKVC